MKKIILLVIISTVHFPSSRLMAHQSNAVILNESKERVPHIAEDEIPGAFNDSMAPSLLKDSWEQLPTWMQDSINRYSILAPTFLFHIMVSAPIISHYETLLKSYPHLMAYLPALMCAGGGTSSQSSTEIIEKMASGQIQDTDMWNIIIKEGKKAGFLGAIVGLSFLILSAIPHLNQLNAREGLSISIPLTVIITFSGILGASMPFILNQLGINPAQAAGPILMTAIDNVSILILFLIGLRVLQIDKQKAA